MAKVVEIQSMQVGERSVESVVLKSLETVVLKSDQRVENLVFSYPVARLLWSTDLMDLVTAESQLVDTIQTDTLLLYS
jgi:hypothetical protein